MKNLLVTTFPMKPLNKLKVGSLTAPVYVEFLSEKLQCKSTLSLNILNSINDIKNYSNEYKNILSGMGINFDSLFIDGHNVDDLIKQIDILDKKGLIKEQLEKILICPCGKIDMLFDSITEINNGLLNVKKDKCYCSICGEECHTIEEKRLFLKISNEYIKKALVIPSMVYDDNLNDIKENLKDKYYLISKGRNTGIKYKNYNIDIDFLWCNYINTFKEKNIIIVTGNKHLNKVFLVNYLSQIFNKNVYFLLHPYIEKKEDINWQETLLKYDDLYKKLFLIFSVKWTTRSCYYDVGYFKSLAKLRSYGRRKMYDNLVSKDKYNNLFDYINIFICNNINYQKQLNRFKNNKMLISDYDNTIKVYYEDIIKNGITIKNKYSEKFILKRLDEFMKTNILCINTGRSYESIKAACPHLKYDYLICNNGAEIYDSCDNLLYLSTLDKNDIDIINEYDFKGATIVKHYPNNINDNYSLTSVSIKTNNENDLNQIVDYFKNNLKNTFCYHKFPKIRLVNNLVDKSTGIDNLIKKINYSKEKIHVIGDDDNDYKMLKDYNSSTVKWCSDKVKKLGIKEYDSIIDCINDMEEVIYEDRI